MTYDAFVSYSHANDALVASAVQRAMQRLARPWYRARALRVFRDESALSANPHLWSSIQEALADSEWLVVLGSPEAAASEWVDREVRHWLATKSADRVLVVVTDGTLEWDGAARRLRGTAVPPAVLDAFDDEPRHLDLRWARSETDLDVHNPRFRDAIAQLAAPIHGMAKDDLESEDVRLSRRARRLARGGVTLLTLLVVVSLVFGTVAAVERAQAQHRQRELSTRNGQLVAQQHATEREREAEVARRLVGEAATALQEHAPDRELLLAVEAARFAGRTGGLVSDDEIRAALVRALTPNPSLVTWLQGLTGTVADVAASPDGSRIAAVTTDGRVGIWDLATYRLEAEFAGPPSAFRVVFTDASTVVVASGTGSLSELPAVTAEVDALVAYHRNGTGTRWTKTWSVPLRQITAIAGSAAGTVAAVTVGSVPSPPNPAFGTFPASEVHLVDARGAETAKIVLPTTAVSNVALAPRGDVFAVPRYAAPMNGAGTSGIDLYRATGALMRRIVIPQLQVGGFGAFPLQLRFSLDGASLGAVAPTIGFPQEPAVLHAIDVATGADRTTPVPTPAAPNLPGGPVGLSPDFTHVTEAYQLPGGRSSFSVADLATATLAGGLGATVTPLVRGGSVPQSWGATAWSRDGTRFAVAGGEGAVPVFALPVTDASHLGRSRDLHGLAPLALSRDGSVVGTSASSLEAVDQRGGRHVLDATVGSELGAGTTFGVGIAFSESGALIADSLADGSVDVLSAQTGHLLAHTPPFGECGGGVPCPVTVDAAGTAAHGLLAVTHGRTTRTWELTGGRLGAHWDLTTADNGSSGLSASGSRLVLTTYTQAAFSPNFTVRVTVYDAAPHAWRKRRSFAGAAGAVDPGILFDNSPDGRRLTEVTASGITTYDLDTGAALWSAALSVSPPQLWYGNDGRTLYTGSTSGADGVLAAWSAQTGTLEFTLPVAGQLVDLADHGSTLTLLVAHKSQSDVVDWSLRTADLVEAACREANRNLTRAEWDRYVGTYDAYASTCPDVRTSAGTGQ